MRMRRTGPEHIHRRMRRVRCAIGSNENVCAGAVGDQATVEQAQRIADHARFQNIVHGDRRPHEGVWVEHRPFPRGDRHFRKLLARRAELMRVPGRHERI
jgi:hypothetical protein